ncbi:MAG: SdpI family protein [Sphingobacteriia bacterium]|jgi:uncharacterized membrane protein
MLKNTTIEWLIILIIIAAPFGYLSSIYNALPQTIPIHFNLEGRANGWGDKSTLIFTTVMMTVIGVGTYFLVKFAHKIDPKKAAGQSPELLKKIALSVLVFLCLIQLIIIHSSLAEQVDGAKFIFPLIGIFLAVLGNFMHSIKPNYFIGFRIPWTLENEENWRKTHFLVSKIWVIGGILIAVFSLLTSPLIGVILSGIILVFMIVLPIVYSYQLYKNQNNTNK